MKTASDPRSLAASVREAVRSIDANLPVSTLRPMDDIVAERLAAPRFTVLLLALFAGVALVLAAVGAVRPSVVRGLPAPA